MCGRASSAAAYNGQDGRGKGPGVSPRFPLNGGASGGLSGLSGHCGVLNPDTVLDPSILSRRKDGFDSRWRYHGSLYLMRVFRCRWMFVAPLWHRGARGCLPCSGNLGAHHIAKLCIDTCRRVGLQRLNDVQTDAGRYRRGLVTQGPRYGL